MLLQVKIGSQNIGLKHREYTHQNTRQQQQLQARIMFPELRELRELRDLEFLMRRAPRRIIADRMNLFELPDHEFIMRFRLNKDSVNRVIHLIEPHLPQHINKRGVPVPVQLQVLITLRYLATGNHQLTISDCYEVSQPLVCRCIHRVSRAIARMSHSVIKMPNNDEAPRVIEDFMAIAGMPGVIGCIDCTHIAIKRPSGDQSERFRNRKGAFSLNVQAVCGPKLQFFNVVARWPGSTHDANIFNNSRLCVEMEDGVHRGRLLGDAGYPCTAFLFTPLTNPQSHQEIRYNRSHITTRNSIERAFGVLKRRFGILGKQMQTDLENTKVLIITAAILHNLAIQWRVPVPDEVVQLQLDEEQEDLNLVPDQHLGGRLQGNIERRQLIENHF